MFLKPRLIVVLLLSWFPAAAYAQPTVIVESVPDGNNVGWIVSFAPDESLFTETTSGVGASMAIEMAFETSGTILAINPFSNEWDTDNPGANPYQSGLVTNGISEHQGVPGLVAGGTVDSVFASLGSRVLNDGDDALAFAITTAGSSGELFWTGSIAQSGFLYTGISGSQAVVGPLLGDADNDGFVKGSDLLAVTNNFGNVYVPGAFGLGDADHDGFVKGSDLLAVTNNFGAAAGSLTVSRVDEAIAASAATALLPGDANNSLTVSGADLLAVTNNFGSVGTADGLLLGDADDDGFVKGSDLLAVTNHFGDTLVASTPGGLAGDYNDDGMVDSADYTPWRDNLGGTAILPNDETPGFVDQSDYDVWSNNYGATGLELASGATTIPEPSALMLAAVATILIARTARN